MLDAFHSGPPCTLIKDDTMSRLLARSIPLRYCIDETTLQLHVVLPPMDVHIHKFEGPHQASGALSSAILSVCNSAPL